MIFSRYSSLFDLLDGYIQTGQFTSFISQFIDIHEEEKVWEIWLNKATGKTWGEFRDLVIPPEIETPDISEMLAESSRTLANFNPYEEVKHGNI